MTSQELRVSATQLANAVGDLTESVRYLTHRARVNRRLIYLLGVLLVVCTGLAITVAIFIVKTTDVIALAKQNRARQAADCRIEQLWAFVVATKKAQTPHPTPQQTAAIVEFEALIRQAYTVLGCH